MRNALVPISSTEREAVQEFAGARGACRPNADFIAQLIAAAIKAPQARQRRRATSGEAVALYRATEHAPVAPGRGFSRFL